MFKDAPELTAEQSKSWAHCYFRISTVYLQTFLISICFMSIGLLFSSREFYVEKDNYVEDFYEERQMYTNETKIRIDELIEALNPLNYLHNLHNRRLIRYTFGSSWHNHCKVFPYPNSINFPSLLRKFTFNAMTQVCFRTAVLISITIRLFSIFCRFADIRNRQSKPSWLFQFYSGICVLFDAATSIFAMFVTVLHLHRDVIMKFLVDNSLAIFAFCFVVSSSLYTLLEYFDSIQKKTRFFERVVAIFLFSAAFPLVNTQYADFLLNEPCLVYVPAQNAICEYVCIAAVIYYYFSLFEDFRSLEVVLSTEAVETMCCMDFVNFQTEYNPAMLRDSLKFQPNPKNAMVFVW